MNLYEYESDCPNLEHFIWGKLAISYGEFEGIREFSENDLHLMQGLIAARLFNIRMQESSHRSQI